MLYLLLLIALFVSLMLLAWWLIKQLFQTHLATVVIGLATTGFWISLFLSYQESISQKMFYDPTESTATGGFPLQALHYPTSPLGGDYPPVDSWPLFLLNYVIWLIAATVLIKLLNHYCKITFSSQAITTGSIIITVLSTLIGSGYLLLKFD